MGKQMEGDNKQRRKAAREAREAGRQPSEFNLTTGGSKQASHSTDDDHIRKLQETQKGEAKQAGPDVPRPLRGKGRSRDAETPPRP